MIDPMEYEALFIEEEHLLKNIPEDVKTFSQGNQKRSFIGEEWYYVGETAEDFTLHKDVIVSENDTHVFIDMYVEEKKLNKDPIALDKDLAKEVYPAQTLFPKPMTYNEACNTLRDYFSDIERSTTIPNGSSGQVTTKRTASMEDSNDSN